MSKQIEALKMAIEALDNACMKIEKWTKGGKWTAGKDALNACKEALAQAEKQEIGEAEIRQMLKEIEWCHQELEKIEKQEPVACSGKYGCKCDKHYTHPATWQSLSDDEIEDIWNRNWDVGYKACARAIEQALKEKNNV